MSLPPSEVPQGAIRFNTDSQKLEFYAQGEWWVMSTDTPNLGTSGDPTPGVRGMFAGGYQPGAYLQRYSLHHNRQEEQFLDELLVLWLVVQSLMCRVRFL